jgi:hypothetical protein
MRAHLRAYIAHQWGIREVVHQHRDASLVKGDLIVQTRITTALEGAKGCQGYRQKDRARFEALRDHFSADWMIE